MEILYQGVRPENEKYRGTCNNCYTVIAIKRNEAKLINSRMEHDCPTCRMAITNFTKMLTHQEENRKWVCNNSY